MIVAVMAYGTLIALLIGLCAWSIEHAQLMRYRPTRGIWAAAIFTSLAFPVAMMALPVEPALPVAATPQVANLLETAPPLASADSAPTAPIHFIPQRLTLPRAPELDTVMAWLWIGTSVSLLGVFGAGWIRLQRMLNRLQLANTEGVDVYIAEKLGPAVFGFLKPRIILPRWILDAPRTTRAMALAHERSHIHAHDPMLFITALMLAALTPWNLPLWWQLRRLRFAIEVDCDQRMMRAGADVCAYGEMLLDVWQHTGRTPVAAIALLEPASQLEKRIQIMTSVRTRPALLWLLACSLFSLSLVVAAAQVAPPQSRTADTEPDTYGAQPSIALQPASPGLPIQMQRQMQGDNRVVFFGRAGNSPLAEQTRKRLSDPELRAAYRSELRAIAQEMHPDVAQVLQLDTTREAAFLDLIADQQLQSMDQIFGAARADAAGDFSAHQQAMADMQTRQLAQLKALLGQVGFERFQNYKETMPDRMQAILLDARLDLNHKLSAQQKERLILVLHDHREDQQELHLQARPYLRALAVDSGERGIPDQQEILRRNIELSEASFRRRQQSDLELLGKLPSVLTREQTEVFSQLLAQSLDANRKFLEGMRASAGMDPNIPDAEDVQLQGAVTVLATREPLTQRIRFHMRVSVNRNDPVEASFDLVNGEVASMQAPENLWVEARPVLFDDGWLQTELTYYETGPGGEHVLLGKLSSGSVTTADTRFTGIGSSLFTGAKGYAITQSVNATPIE